MKKGLLFFLVLPFLFTLSGADLVKDGESLSVILVHPEASVGEFFAASELSTFIEKITGVSIPVRTAPVPGGKHLIHLAMTRTPELPPEVVGLFHKLKDDGFLILANAERTYIVSREERGVAYGVYEILKRYGGVRFFYPGEEGEFIQESSSFSISDGTLLINPSFSKRAFNLTGGPQNHLILPTLLWMLRNNMSQSIKRILLSKGKMVGGHDFCTLLPKELFETNPELFPMVDGKRHAPSCTANAPGYANPCVSNPDTLRLMTEEIVKRVNADRSITNYYVLQNDTTRWCECPDCKKLDSELDRENHFVSNRFWIMANAVIESLQKETPSVGVTVWAYINAETAPDRVKINPNCDLLYCMVRRCHIHTLNDPTCAINSGFRQRLEAWRKLEMNISTYEYSTFIPQGNEIGAPLEKVHASDLKFYKTLGLIGYSDERAPLVAEPEKYFIKSYLPKMANSWLYDAIPRYFQAYFLWNADADFEEIMEDFGSKYYGKTWPEMRQYRTLFRERYTGVASHFMYGTSSLAAGRVLDAKSEETLSTLLKTALLKVKSDELLTKRLVREQKNLEGFIAKREEYAKIEAMRTMAVKIEAVPSTQDWASAPAVVDFSGRSEEIQKTSAKLLYDATNLYVKVEAMEAKMDKMAQQETERDAILWNDSTVEFFFAPSSLGGKYLHCIVNPLGTFYDAMTLHPSDSDKSFDSKGIAHVEKKSDRWIVTLTLPFAALGGAPTPGEAWKINIARGRVLTDGTQSEYSSWSLGEFHGPDVYRLVIFEN